MLRAAFRVLNASKGVAKPIACIPSLNVLPAAARGSVALRGRSLHATTMAAATGKEIVSTDTAPAGTLQYS